MKIVNSENESSQSLRDYIMKRHYFVTGKNKSRKVVIIEQDKDKSIVNDKDKSVIIQDIKSSYLEKEKDRSLVLDIDKDKSTNNEKEKSAYKFGFQDKDNSQEKEKSIVHEKDRSIALELNINSRIGLQETIQRNEREKSIQYEKNNEKDKNSLKSFNDFDGQFKSFNQQLIFALPHKNALKQEVLAPNKIESFNAMFKESENSLPRKFKITVYDAFNSLVLCIEDKSYRSTLQQQKELQTNTNAVFKKTLIHFQYLVRKAIATLNEVSSKYIPSLLLYNTLLLNMQIHNVTDYIKLKSEAKRSKSNSGNKEAGNNIQQSMPFHNQIYNGTFNKQSNQNNHQSNNHLLSGFQQNNTPQNPNINNIGLDKVQSQQESGNAFSKMTNSNFFLNSMNVKLERLDLSEMLGQLDKLMTKVCAEKKIKFLLVNETPKEQMIVTDKNKLYRVLVNYISNSVRNTERGYIQLKIICSNNLGISTIKFELIDSGIGMYSTTAAQQATPADFKSNLNLDLNQEQEPEFLQPLPQNIRKFSYEQDSTPIKQNQLLGNNSIPVSPISKKEIGSGRKDSLWAPPLLARKGQSVNNSSFSMEESNMQLFNENQQENSTILINQTFEKQNQKQEGLGIGMIVSKYLINRLGPSFPKVFSKKGIGTNVTFEVYSDLKTITKGSQNFTSPNFSYPIPAQKRHHTSFSLFHGQVPQTNSIARDIAIKEAMNQSGGNQTSAKKEDKSDEREKAISEKIKTDKIEKSGIEKITNNQLSSGNHQQQTSSGFGGSIDNLLNNGGDIKSIISAQKASAGQQFPIQLDAEENVDEDAQEFKNLGANCYRLIGNEEISLNVQKSEYYLVPREIPILEQTDPFFSSTTILQNFNKIAPFHKEGSQIGINKESISNYVKENTHHTSNYYQQGNASIFQSSHFYNHSTPYSNNNNNNQILNNIGTSTNNNNFGNSNPQLNSIFQKTFTANTANENSHNHPLNPENYQKNTSIDNNIHSDNHVYCCGSSNPSRTSSRRASLANANNAANITSLVGNPSNPSQLLPFRLPSNDGVPPHFGQASSTYSKGKEKEGASNTHFGNITNNNMNGSNHFYNNTFNQQGNQNQSQYSNNNQQQNTYSNHYSSYNHQNSINQFTTNTNTFFNSTHIANLNQVQGHSRNEQNSSLGSFSKIEDIVARSLLNQQQTPLVSQFKWSSHNFNINSKQKRPSTPQKSKKRIRREIARIQDGEPQIVCSSPDFLDPNAQNQEAANQKQLFLIQLQQYKIQQQIIKQEQINQQRNLVNSSHFQEQSENNKQNHQNNEPQLTFQNQIPLQQQFQFCNTSNGQGISEISSASFIHALKPQQSKEQNHFQASFPEHSFNATFYPQVSHSHPPQSSHFNDAQSKQEPKNDRVANLEEEFEKKYYPDQINENPNEDVFIQKVSSEINKLAQVPNVPRKRKSRSSFNLIFDMKTNGNDEQEEGNNNNNINHPNVLSNHNLLNSELGSQSNLTLSSSHSPGQHAAPKRYPFSILGESSINSFQPVNPQNYFPNNNFIAINANTPIPQLQNNSSSSNSANNINNNPFQQMSNLPLSNMSPFEIRARISSASSPSPLIFQSVQRNHSSSTHAIPQIFDQAPMQFSPKTEQQLFPVNLTDGPNDLYPKQSQTAYFKVQQDARQKDKDSGMHFPSSGRAYKISIGGAEEKNLIQNECK